MTDFQAPGGGALPRAKRSDRVKSDNPTAPRGRLEHRSLVNQHKKYTKMKVPTALCATWIS